MALAEHETQRAWTEAGSYRERMRSLYEVAYTLSTTMNYQSVLDIALVESRQIVQYSCALVLLSTGNLDEVYVAASQGLREDERGMRLQIGKGKVEQSLRTGDAILLTDVYKEPELQSVRSLQNCRAGLPGAVACWAADLWRYADRQRAYRCVFRTKSLA